LADCGPEVYLVVFAAIQRKYTVSEEYQLENQFVYVVMSCAGINRSKYY